MPSTAPPTILEPFLAAADAVASARADVDVETARELMAEAAGMLHDSLALDHLDEHDLPIAVAGLAADLTALDPGAAVRARAGAVGDRPDLHDPDGVRGAFLVSAQVLGL
ncbi:hypothetical protein [Nocardioides pinisoli]|uniref:DUF222 domain-containing protein n=1 Tax=Nocardioides pinisoli TaxID=2950279 RepID=A0ABT1KXJ6_9ACTN|nr:hypothetical protein [Nocardioides pinisoli]MCP3422064.1 hypothetical protein [Nocardioides pinisoli]